jgi:hypothetical protein
MNCLEFRRRVGAEPAVTDDALVAHRQGCAACARYQDELRAMDGQIARALAVDADGIHVTVPARAPRPAPDRRRLFAIAASVAIGLAVGLLLLVSAPRASIAREVIDHVLHEPGTMASAAPVAPAALAAVLGPGGMRLKPGIGDVSFAALCMFEGRVVPHLVVRTPQGPVTVLMLRHRELDEPMHVSEQGFDGVILPAPRGSVAVVGQGLDDLDGIAQKVFEAVDWGA